MTSEVALLNRRAVALAADSATTVTYREGRERKQRHFKGTNKIFNLSESCPVAIMTYSNANLQGIPWEVVIKAYRATLGKKSHASLDDYVTDLFKFIEDNDGLFTEEFMAKQFIADAINCARFIIFYTDPELEIAKETDPTEAG